MCTLGGGEGEHALRDVHPDHLGRARVGQVRGELAHAAAEIEHALSLEGGEKPHEVGVLDGPGPPRSESLQPRVAGEELWVVVDVLRSTHRRPPKRRARQSRHDRRGGAKLMRSAPACTSRARGGSAGQRMVTAARFPPAPVRYVAATCAPALGCWPCCPSPKRRRADPSSLRLTT